MMMLAEISHRLGFAPGEILQSLGLLTTTINKMGTWQQNFRLFLILFKRKLNFSIKLFALGTVKNLFTPLSYA